MVNRARDRVGPGLTLSASALCSPAVEAPSSKGMRHGRGVDSQCPGRHHQAEGDARPPGRACLKPTLTRVNTLILERMQSPVALIPQLAGHIVAAGGKRLRPMLTLAAARMCGYRGDRTYALAAAVEFIHTATLAPRRRRRRQRPPPRPRHRQRGLGQQALGAGRRFPVQPRLRADGRGRLARRARHSVQGLGDHRRGRGAAARDLERHRRPPRPPISRSSTPRPRSFSPRRARIGAVLGAALRGRGEGARNPMAAISASPSSWSTTCSIIRRARPSSARPSATISATARSPCRWCWRSGPPTSASANSGAARSKRWSRATEDLAHAGELMRRHGTLDATLDRAREYGAAARAQLAAFRAGPERAALDEVIDFCLERGY